MLFRSNLAVAALLFGGLIPTVLAAVLTQSVPHERALTGRRERENLVFSQYAVHLGEVRPIGTIPAHFDFFNSGDSPIEIVNLEPSCGCLAPRLYEDKKLYGPGERGRFYVSVKTANETPGPKDYTVKVQYLDEVPKETFVTFHLTVPEKKVAVFPAEVYFYQTHGTAEYREIMVEDHRGLNLNVLDVVCTSEIPEITIGQKVLDGNVSRTPIRIDVPAEVPPGKRTALMTIETDDPEYRLIRVPILIWGPKDGIQQASAESPE